MAASAYSITLHHLSPDATEAGLSYPDEQLANVSATQLRDLLIALSDVASRLTIYEPSAPEIRVKTDRDIYVIRTRYRRLCFVGWEAILRGEDHSISYIVSTITGTTDLVKIAPKVERIFASPTSSPARETGRYPRWVKVAALGVVIIGFNATTVWMLLKPAKNLMPEHEYLSEDESRALLTKTAGEFETGGAVGDRQLILDAEGTLHLAKFGANRAATEQRVKTVRGAVVGGKNVLVTSDPAVLVIKDADTIVLYGTTYRRHLR